MSEVKFVGFVSKIFEKRGTSKNNKPYTLYSAKLQNAETGEEFPEWFQFGFYAPEAKEGDYVQIVGTVKQEGRVEVLRLNHGKNPPARPARPEGGSGGGKKGGGGGGGKGGYGRSKEDWAAHDKHQHEVVEPRISLTASRNAAIEVVKVLQQADALPITAAAGKANKAKRYDEVLAIIDKLTVRFYNDVFDGLTSRLLENVQDEGGVSTSGHGGELPDDDDDDGFESDDEVADGGDDAEDGDDGFE